MESLSASRKKPQNLNFNELPYKITFTNVTFAAHWNGKAYIVAIDYSHYYIGKLCSVGLNKGKYVSCECFKIYDKVYYIRRFAHF